MSMKNLFGKTGWLIITWLYNSVTKVKPGVKGCS